MSKFFIQIGGVGLLDDKGKLEFSKSYKRIVAQPDGTLSLLADLIEKIIMPMVGYSSEEAAKKDVEAFKEWANGLYHEPPTPKDAA